MERPAWSLFVLWLGEQRRYFIIFSGHQGFNPPSKPVKGHLEIVLVHPTAPPAPPTAPTAPPPAELDAVLAVLVLQEALHERVGKAANVLEPAARHFSSAAAARRRSRRARRG